MQNRGVCCTLRMHRIAIISRAGEDNDDNRGCVFGVWTHGLRVENRDHVPANQRWGEGVVHHQCSRPGIRTNNRGFVYFGRAITADRELCVEITRRIQRA